MQPQANDTRLHALDYWQVIRNRFAIILLTFCLVFVTALAITHVLPRQYLGRAALEIVQDEADLTMFANRIGGADFASMNFIQTQFEIITSQQTLYKVIEDHNLVERWNTGTKAAAYHRLNKRTDPSARRNTNLIDIEVYADEPEEAALLANSIAENYSKRRQEEDDQRLQKAVTALSLQVDNQEQVVSAAQTQMLALARELNIAELAPGGNYSGNGNEPMTSAPNLLYRGEMDVYTHELDIEKLRTQVERLRGLSGDALIEQAIALDVADITVRELYPRYFDEQKQEQKMLNEGRGRKHPKVLSIQAQLEKSRELLQNSVENIRDSLQTRLEIAEGSLEKIESMRDSRKEDAMSERESHVAYTEAKKEFTRQQLILDTMRERLVTADIDRKMTTTPIRIHEFAEANSIPAKPNVMLNLVLGGIVGLGLGLGMAFFIEYLDTSVKSIEDVENLLGVPVLAVVPKDVGLLMTGAADNLDAEAYRILRTNIEFNRTRGDANAISVVSGSAGEGKSTTLTNLAYVCAQAGYTTLLIDGDLRRPKLHTFFQVDNSHGLSTYLGANESLEQTVFKSHVENLWFMPSGVMPTDASGLLNSKRMRDMMADLKSRFDVILIDAPPILGVSDGAVLASEADMTIAVVQHRKLPQKTLMRVKQAVDNAGGNLLGVVLNNVDVRSDSQYQYYTSYYTYYSTPEPTKSAPKPSRKNRGRERVTQQQAPVSRESQPAPQSQQQVQPQQPPQEAPSQPRPQQQQQHYDPYASAPAAVATTTYHPQNRAVSSPGLFGGEKSQQPAATPAAAPRYNEQDDLY